MVISVVKLFRREGYIPSNNCVMKPGQSQKQRHLPKKDSMVKLSVGHQHLGQVTRGQHRVDQVTRGQHCFAHCLFSKLTRGQHRFSHIKSGIQGLQQVTRGQYKVKQNILGSFSEAKTHHHVVSRCRFNHHNYFGASLHQEKQGGIMLDRHASGFSNLHRGWARDGRCRTGPQHGAVLACLHRSGSHHHGPCFAGAEGELGDDSSVKVVNSVQPWEAGLQEDRCFYDPG